VICPPASETAPCVFAPPVTLVTLSVWPDSSGAPALSLAERSEAGKESGVSSCVAFSSAPATGASLTSVTVIVTVEMLECSDPWLARKVKLSVPLNSGAGVYSMVGPMPVSVPCEGPLTMV
jgi:hypothetical protein